MSPPGTARSGAGTWPCARGQAARRFMEPQHVRGVLASSHGTAPPSTSALKMGPLSFPHTDVEGKTPQWELGYTGGPRDFNLKEVA